MQETQPLEIERKFLIGYPDCEELKKLAQSVSEIWQTYLVSEEGASARVRKRIFRDRVEFTKTVKVRLSDMTRVERESEISAEEYERLLREEAIPGLRTIHKWRYCVPYRGQVCEIDVYDFWQDRATLEIETESETQEVFLPPFVTLLREVTFEKGYTNRAMAKELPAL